MNDLPAAIVRVHEGSNAARTPKLVAIGHSLGGAVLGAAATREDTGLTRIILIGVDSVVDADTPFGLVAPSDGPTPVKLVFLRGEKDGLAEAEKVTALARKYSNSQVLPAVPGVNHFCIIDGNPGHPRIGTVGAPGKLAEDNVSPLPTVRTRVDAMVGAVEGQLD